MTFQSHLRLNDFVNHWILRWFGLMAILRMKTGEDENGRPKNVRVCGWGLIRRPEFFE